MGYGDRARQTTAVLGLHHRRRDQLRRRRLAGARGVGQRRHLPADARHQRASLRAEEGAATRSTRSRGERPVAPQIRRHAAENMHARLRTCRATSNSCASSPRISPTRSRNGNSSSRADRAVGQAPFPAAQQGRPGRSRRCRWGGDLLSFKPEANLGDQVAKVEVHGWDEVNKKQILGVARAGQRAGRRDAGRRYPAARLRSSEPVLDARVCRSSRSRKPTSAPRPSSHKRANDLSRARARRFGLPELLPDTRVKLDGLGAKFSTDLTTSPRRSTATTRPATAPASRSRSRIA